MSCRERCRCVVCESVRGPSPSVSGSRGGFTASRTTGARRMSTSWWIGLTSSFLASGVEVVEAATIVLAGGGTRGWGSTWVWGGAAALGLAPLGFVLGPTVDRLIPLGAVRGVVGAPLLIF